MRLTRPFLAALTMTLSVGAACAPSGNTVRQPTAGTDSSPETTREPVAEGTPAPPEPVPPPDQPYVDPGPPLAAPPPRPVVTRMPVPQPTGPYRVRVVDESHNPLPVFGSGGRTYVMGTVGSRYSIVVANPTGQRVEAVISVDGLDAMDGHPADYVAKRGYIIPAYGDLTVDGFRTSYDEVATFRFSSVADSYAGRLGDARDVGVIGVAFFPEEVRVVVPEPSVVTNDHPTPHPPPKRRAARHVQLDVDSLGGSNGPPPPPAPPSAMGGASGGGGGSIGSLATRTAPKSAAPAPAEDKRRADVDRPGLGTEFGEARSSHIGTTSFDRANRTTPRQVVALRYNNRAGLVALGIVFPPSPSEADLRLRETAEPFRENRFAQAPP